MALTVVHIQVLNNIFMFFTRLRLSQPLDVGQHLDMNKVGDYSEMLMAPVDSDWDEIIWTRRNFHVIEASSISSTPPPAHRRGEEPMEIMLILMSRQTRKHPIILIIVINNFPKTNQTNKNVETPQSQEQD